MRYGDDIITYGFAGATVTCGCDGHQAYYATPHPTHTHTRITDGHPTRAPTHGTTVAAYGNPTVAATHGPTVTPYDDHTAVATTVYDGVAAAQPQ